mmetsp:Transcript_8700/g.26129  ORF Transcript_8700/g.26129 Transcript_8700/m.26129 type:complete len:209 (+) Transcript_8700:8249-8875(+)
MVLRARSSGFGIANMAKCRTNRGDTGLRPPPGGAHPAIRVTSSISFHRPAFSRSYKPWKSWYCRNNSMGGCEPYVSSFGMLRSSTKMHTFFSRGAPRTFFLRFSSFDSIIFWVRSDDVCAEKLRISGTSLPSLAAIESRQSFAITDLPTPVSPVKSTDLLPSRYVESSQLNLTVSTVGTSMSKNGISGLYSNFGTISSHFLNVGGDVS